MKTNQGINSKICRNQTSSPTVYGINGYKSFKTNALKNYCSHIVGVDSFVYLLSAVTHCKSPVDGCGISFMSDVGSKKQLHDLPSMASQSQVSLMSVCELHFVAFPLLFYAYPAMLNPRAGLLSLFFNGVSGQFCLIALIGIVSRKYHLQQAKITSTI